MLFSFGERLFVLFCCCFNAFQYCVEISLSPVVVVVVAASFHLVINECTCHSLFMCVCVHSLIAFPEQICVKLLLLILLLFYRFVAKGFANYPCCCMPNCANHYALTCCTHTHTHIQRDNKTKHIKYLGQFVR